MRTKVAKKGAYRQNLQGLCRLYFPLNGSCHLDIPYTLDGGCHEKYAKNILDFDLWLWSLLSLSECIDLHYILKSLGDTKILSCIEFTFKFFTQQGQVITFMILEVEDYQLFSYWAKKLYFKWYFNLLIPHICLCILECFLLSLHSPVSHLQGVLLHKSITVKNNVMSHYKTYLFNKLCVNPGKCITKILSTEHFDGETQDNFPQT